MNEGLRRKFPGLSDSNHGITSARTSAYNCFAFAVDDESRWWEPGDAPRHFWPKGAPREYTLEALIAALGTEGFQRCDSSELEPGWEKIAVFTAPDGMPTHAARQLPDGKWTSKLGKLEDIRHDQLQDVSCEDYGVATVFLRRPVRAR